MARPENKKGTQVAQARIRFLPLFAALKWLAEREGATESTRFFICRVLNSAPNNSNSDNKPSGSSSLYLLTCRICPLELLDLLQASLVDTKIAQLNCGTRTPNSNQYCRSKAFLWAILGLELSGIRISPCGFVLRLYRSEIFPLASSVRWSL